MKVEKLHPLFAAELTGADAANPAPELVDTVEEALIGEPARPAASLRKRQLYQHSLSRR